MSLQSQNHQILKWTEVRLQADGKNGKYGKILEATHIDYAFRNAV